MCTQRSVKGLFLLSVLLVLGNAQIWAQDSQIQGVISDETKAVIPGAEVVVTHIRTGVQKKVVTDDVGFYSVPFLSEGRYKVECSMPGFTTQETQVQIQVGQVARVDFQMKLGEVTEVVEVAAEGSILQAKPTDVGEVIEEKRILEMPLNGRNYLDLAKLATGVLPARQLGRGHRAGEEGSFIAVGMHGAQNNVLLDGSDNSSMTSGGPLGFEAQAVKPPIDAVSEFKVITNNTSAEHGYRTGAKVMVSTKAGTNEFHGSLMSFIATMCWGRPTSSRIVPGPKNPNTFEISLAPLSVDRLSRTRRSFLRAIKGRGFDAARALSPQFRARPHATAIFPKSRLSGGIFTTR